MVNEIVVMEVGCTVGMKQILWKMLTLICLPDTVQMKTLYQVCYG